MGEANDLTPRPNPANGISVSGETLESQYGRTISFMEFLKVGSIITVTNIAIYTPFILLL